MFFSITYPYLGFYLDHYLIMDDHVDVNKSETGNSFLFKRFNTKSPFFKHYQTTYYKKKMLNTHELCVKSTEP